MENLLDLVLIGWTRIGKAAGILHGIGCQDRDVVGLGAQFGEAGGSQGNALGAVMG
jgi:hypothetical protein